MNRVCNKYNTKSISPVLLTDLTCFDCYAYEDGICTKRKMITKEFSEACTYYLCKISSTDKEGIKRTKLSWFPEI